MGRSRVDDEWEKVLVMVCSTNVDILRKGARKRNEVEDLDGCSGVGMRCGSFLGMDFRG